jgi:hypothetical protein
LTSALYLEFWQGLVDYLSKSGSTLQPAKPYPQNWLYLKMAPGGFCLETTAVSNSQHPRLSCGLTIKRPDAQEILAWLRDQCEAIDAGFGTGLDWMSRNDKSMIECHIQTHWEGISIRDRTAWPQQYQWLQENLEKLKGLFSSLIETKANGIALVE